MEINFPVTGNSLESLKVLDEVLVSGDLIVARDQSLKRIVETLNRKENLFLKMEGIGVFFAGPLPRTKKTDPIIIGPTTAQRMDKFSPLLFSGGVKAIIGKGPVGAEVRQACQQYKSVYLMVTGGVAAYLSKFFREMEIILWPELGPEAVYNLQVEKMPAVVAIDTEGNTAYASDY